jgi:hypothetical protein
MLRLSVVVMVLTATVAIGATQNAARDALDTGISLRGLVKLAPQSHENGTAVAFMFSEAAEGKVTVVFKATFEAAFPAVGKSAQKGQELTAAMFHNLLHTAAVDSEIGLRFADQNPALQRGDMIKGLNMAAVCGVERVENQVGTAFALKCFAGDRKIETGTRMNFSAVVVDAGARLTGFLEGRQAVWVRLED